MYPEGRGGIGHLFRAGEERLQEDLPHIHNRQIVEACQPKSSAPALFELQSLCVMGEKARQPAGGESATTTPRRKLDMFTVIQRGIDYIVGSLAHHDEGNARKHPEHHPEQEVEPAQRFMQSEGRALTYAWGQVMWKIERAQSERKHFVR